VGLDELKTKAEAGAIDFLLPLEAALSGLPFVHLTADEARRALNGMALRVDAQGGWREGSAVGMRGADGSLLAVGHYDAASRTLRPRVVFSPEK
jgi:hypothetical protein